MRIQKPTRRPTKPMLPSAKHPMSLPGMRWVPTSALSPANVLHLQQSAGNQAVARLLRRYADPDTGSLSALKTYQAARRDGVVPVQGVDAEPAMRMEDPRLGDWQFRFVADAKGGGGALYWITLANFKQRQRDILIDATTNEPLDVTGGDLDARDKQLLLDWAAEMLVGQLKGQSQPQPQQPPAGGPDADEEDDDFLDGLFGDDGEDDGGSGLGALAAAAAALASGRKNGSEGGAQGAARGGKGAKGGQGGSKGGGGAK